MLRQLGGIDAGRKLPLVLDQAGKLAAVEMGELGQRSAQLLQVVLAMRSPGRRTGFDAVAGKNRAEAARKTAAATAKSTNRQRAGAGAAGVRATSIREATNSQVRWARPSGGRIMAPIDIEQSQLLPQHFQILPQGGIAAQLRFDADLFVRLERVEQVTNEIVSHVFARQLRVTRGIKPGWSVPTAGSSQ